VNPAVVTDGNSEEVTHGGESDEEAAWLDLIGRFDAPVDTVPTWPELEDLGGARAPRAPVAPDDSAAPGGSVAPEGTVVSEGSVASEGTVAPELAPPPVSPSAPRSWTAPEDPEDEHYVPPAPPPLQLSPTTKGAWVGLFGGPAYLLLATLMSWSIPGWALFGAIGAFVGGFMVLVLHVGAGSRDDDDPDSDSDDDGAVV
jgi:hypothetical protein